MKSAVPTLLIASFVTLQSSQAEPPPNVRPSESARATGRFLPFPPSRIQAERTKQKHQDQFTRIYRVKQVNVRLMESYPEQLHIQAVGSARTGGWSDARLRLKRGQRMHGVYEFVSRQEDLKV